MKNNKMSRRSFMSQSTRGATGLMAAGSVLHLGSSKVLGANDRVNMAVIGVRSRGNEHINEWLKMPGVQVKSICDIDANFLPERAKMIKEKQGVEPKTETDIRRILEDKEIDAISIATPDHWHALAAIWGCQAGKHVYAEKPLSHTIWEGEQMIKAARKYSRIVQCGLQNRSITVVQKAMELVHSGELGEIYKVKGLCFKPRNSIGRKADCQPPQGVDYDTWLGPARYRAFNPNRFHYNWHWFWDYGCADIGNQGPHQMDIARWALNKNEWPQKIKCSGGYFAFDSDQETPNTQSATFEYKDGKILEFDVRGLYTNTEGSIGIGNLIYGTKGWMEIDAYSAAWKTFFGRDNEPGPSHNGTDDAADAGNLAGTGGSGHFVNFIESVRSGDWTKLNCDVEQGHKSTALCHLANISYRLNRELNMDEYSGKFIDDEIANEYLTKEYRQPFVLSSQI
jgi:predicted dehydrogenase